MICEVPRIAMSTPSITPGPHGSGHKQVDQGVEQPSSPPIADYLPTQGSSELIVATHISHSEVINSSSPT
jgi:hypothetical protein